MRIDTKRLLDRLGQPDFNYREYAEAPASSTERWPLFEVVSRQLRQAPLLTSDLHTSADAAEEAKPSIPDGSDIQRMIARIAQGRPA